jgi:hypothetical protein
MLMSAAGVVAVGACTGQAVSLRPELDGTLAVDGRAAQGAEVFVGFSGDHDKPCSGLTPSARTDGNGQFHVPSRQARLTAKEIAAIPYGTTPNYVCFRYRGQLIVDSLFLIEPSNHKSYVAKCVSPRPVGAIGEDAQVCWWRVRMPNNSFKPKPLRGSA